MNQPGKVDAASQALKWALLKKCPRCGQDDIFQRWHEVKPACEHCGLEFQERESDCWAFMYITTAFLTGLFLVAVLLYRPQNLLLGRAILFSVGLAVLTLSLPYRKALALGIEHLANPDGD